MHPKNAVQSTKGYFFDWISDYRGSTLARRFLKRKTVRRIRRDGKRQISSDLFILDIKIFMIQYLKIFI